MIVLHEVGPRYSHTSTLDREMNYELFIIQAACVGSLPQASYCLELSSTIIVGYLRGLDFQVNPVSLHRYFEIYIVLTFLCDQSK